MLCLVMHVVCLLTGGRFARSKAGCSKSALRRLRPTIARRSNSGFSLTIAVVTTIHASARSRADNARFRLAQSPSKFSAIPVPPATHEDERPPLPVYACSQGKRRNKDNHPRTWSKLRCAIASGHPLLPGGTRILPGTAPSTWDPFSRAGLPVTGFLRQLNSAAPAF
jgi:hypothetical protein